MVKSSVGSGCTHKITDCTHSQRTSRSDVHRNGINFQLALVFFFNVYSFSLLQLLHMFVLLYLVFISIGCGVKHFWLWLFLSHPTEMKFSGLINLCKKNVSAKFQAERHFHCTSDDYFHLENGHGEAWWRVLCLFLRNLKWSRVPPGRWTTPLPTPLALFSCFLPAELKPQETRNFGGKIQLLWTFIVLCCQLHLYVRNRRCLTGPAQLRLYNLWHDVTWF